MIKRDPNHGGDAIEVDVFVSRRELHGRKESGRSSRAEIERLAFGSTGSLSK